MSIDLNRNKLQNIFDKPLPGWDIHQEYIPVSGFPNIEYNTDKELRKGAVLICIYEEGDGLHTVLIERTPDSSPHSGQIAFPGGKYEDFDGNQVTTALREANEEVGIDTNKLNVLGCLSSIQIPVSGFTVLPVLAWYDGYPELTASPDEVASLIRVPLDELLNSKDMVDITARGYQIKTAAFKAGEHIVWGATAMVIGELKEMLNGKS